MLVRKLSVSAALVSFAVTLLLLGLYNFTFWRTLAAVAAVPFLISIAFLLVTFLYTCLLLISYKCVFKPFLILVFLVAALSAYAMDNFGYVISADAFQALFESHISEMRDIFNRGLLINLILFFVLPIVLLSSIKIKYLSFRKIALHLNLSILIIFLNVTLFSKEYSVLVRNNRHLRYSINPVRPLYSLAKYFRNNVFNAAPQEFVLIDQMPTRTIDGNKPKLVILVVGESDRAMNHSLNGYARNTNPLLKSHGDVYSFSNFYACGTETSISVPCMFSPFSRTEYTQQKGRYTENVLDILQKTGIEVLWRDNDGGCKHVCTRVAIEDFNNAKIVPYCDNFECEDEVLLHDLQKHIDQRYGNKLIILHKLGNHGPAYYKRYPERFAKFTPTCDTNEIQICSNQQIINTYDNIILYTDYFLDQVIKHLEFNNSKYQTALIYVSDHGESLGENGVYLHALPYWMAPQEQTHIPFFFWASKDFDVDRKHLLDLQHQELSHDYLFHSLLGLFNVQTHAYNANLDLFAYRVYAFH